jgi:hypothetical protein
MDRPVTVRLLQRLLLPALLALPALPSSAAAVEEDTSKSAIEGVWSFGGGAVAIKGLSDGTLQGTVVNPTKFATCDHPAGQVMWTGMNLQADGSFWGLHQWFHGGEKCEVNPVLGLTAWRVLVDSAGARRLVVCFSTPGDNSQPTIAPNGSTANATFGCTESSPIAPLPKSNDKAEFVKVVEIPGATACRARRSLKIKLHNPKYDPLKEVLVRVKGKKVADVKGTERLKKGIRIKNLPEGTFKMSVLAITVLNRRLKGSRTYNACVQGPGKIKIPGAKSHTRH